jgi:hypothetical protein
MILLSSQKKIKDKEEKLKVSCTTIISCKIFLTHDTIENVEGT